MKLQLQLQLLFLSLSTSVNSLAVINDNSKHPSLPRQSTSAPPPTNLATSPKWTLSCNGSPFDIRNCDDGKDIVLHDLCMQQCRCEDNGKMICQDLDRGCRYLDYFCFRAPCVCRYDDVVVDIDDNDQDEDWWSDATEPAETDALVLQSPPTSLILDNEEEEQDPPPLEPPPPKFNVNCTSDIAFPIFCKADRYELNSTTCSTGCTCDPDGALSCEPFGECDIATMLCTNVIKCVCVPEEDEGDGGMRLLDLEH